MPHDACNIAPGRLGWLVAVLTVAFVAGVALLKSAQLILVLNSLALPVSVGLATAYLPVAAGALRRRHPSRGDVLGAGIFFAGLSDAALRVQSVIARDFGRPDIVNSDFAALSIFLGIMALVAFLWAPDADDGRVPRDKWRMIAFVVGSGIAIAVISGLAQRAMVATPIRLE